MDGRQRAATARREATRARILAAAVEEWDRLDDVAAQRGVRPTVRVEAIAARAGVSVSTVYEHFPSQGLIAGHALRQLLDDPVRRWLAEEGPTADPVDALLAVTRDAVAVMLRHRALSATMMDAVATFAFRHGPPDGRPDDPRAPLLLPFRLAALVQRCQAAGRVRDDVAAADAAATITNLLFLQVLTRPERGVDGIVGHILAVPVEGLLVR